MFTRPFEKAAFFFQSPTDPPLPNDLTYEKISFFLHCCTDGTDFARLSQKRSGPYSGTS